MGLALAPAEVPVLRQKLADWRADAVLFVRECLGVAPDAWQVEVLRAWSNPHDPKCRRIAMQACAGPGKSAVEAWCAWNFLLCYGSETEHPNGAAVSMTGENLKDGLWKELAVWHGRSPLLSQLFTWTQTRIFANDHPSTWFLSARTWSKTADTEAQGRTLSGLHSPYIAYFLDESGSIPPPVLRSAEQGLSNCRWGKIVQAGNPTSHEGVLYVSAAKQADLWTIIRISGDPEDPMRSPRIDAVWAAQQITLHGRENPWVMAYILGKFPPTSINALLGPDQVATAIQRALREEDFAHQQKRLGIDCARFGDDRTVIFPRQGLQAFEPEVLRGKRGTEIAAKVMDLKARWGGEMEFLDDTGGWGQSTIDTLIAAGHAPIGVQFHAPAIDAGRFANRRAEMWVRMAEWVKRGGSIPKIDGLEAELLEPTYSYTRDGKLLIEPKDAIKARLGRSPDLADALALTFALPEMPTMLDPRTGLPTDFGRGGNVVTDWDPLKRTNWAA